jgi:hypothetical protein
VSPVNAVLMRRLRRRVWTARGPGGPRPFAPPAGLWIGGVNYTSSVILDSPKIRSTAYSQTGVLSFRLDGVVGGPLANVRVEQEATLNKGGVLYAGLVRTITPVDDRPTSWALDVECQDFTTFLNESICAWSNAYTNPVRTNPETDAQRISWLLQSYDRYGITASHVQTLTSSMPPQDFTGMSLTEAIKKVLEFGNGSFYVDFAKDLHTFTSETNPAPFGLSDTPDDVTTFAFSNFAYPKDSVDLANAVYAIPGVAAMAEPTVVDTATETISTAGGPITNACLVMASFKGIPGKALRVVGNPGSLVIGSSSLVAPQFGQMTSAGNSLVAGVTADAAIPTTSAPGWVEVVQAASNPAAHVAIWAKPNCELNEAPPIFTAGSASPMVAQLAELTGVSLAPIDRTAFSGASASSASLSLPAADALGGELVVLASIWLLTGSATASFAETFNNSMATIHVGDSGGIAAARHSSFTFGLIPAAAPTWYTDEPSIATYGRREASIKDDSVTTQAALNLLGAAFLAAHKNPLQHCSLKCKQPGLTAGMTINVTNGLYGLVAQPFRIQELTTTYPDGIVPEFEVQFADPVVTVASQMVAMQDQLAGDRTATSSDVQKLAAVVAANTLGTLGYAEVTANQGPFSAVTDLTGLTVTVTVGTGRRIRISALVDLFGTVANDQSEVDIAEGATVLQSVIMRHAATGHLSHEPERILTPTPGSHTYKLTGQRLSGTGTFTMQATGNQPAYILVEDIGT